MECNQCGGLMMPETVIKLRRGIVGFRETRFPGAYCATCRTGVTIGDHATAAHQPASATIRPGNGIGSLLPTRLRRGVSRPGRSQTGTAPFPWRGRGSRMPAWMPARRQRVALGASKALPGVLVDDPAHLAAPSDLTA
jgi:hypothetical protein